jgi:hypothetical protein
MKHLNHSCHIHSLPKQDQSSPFKKIPLGRTHFSKSWEIAKLFFIFVHYVQDLLHINILQKHLYEIISCFWISLIDLQIFVCKFDELINKPYKIYYIRKSNCLSLLFFQSHWKHDFYTILAGVSIPVTNCTHILYGCHFCVSFIKS